VVQVFGVRPEKRRHSSLWCATSGEYIDGNSKWGFCAGRSITFHIATSCDKENICAKGNMCNYKYGATATRVYNYLPPPNLPAKIVAHKNAQRHHNFFILRLRATQF